MMIVTVKIIKFKTFFFEMVLYFNVLIYVKHL